MDYMFLMNILLIYYSTDSIINTLCNIKVMNNRENKTSIMQKIYINEQDIYVPHK